MNYKDAVATTKVCAGLSVEHARLITAPSRIQPDVSTFEVCASREVELVGINLLNDVARIVCTETVPRAISAAHALERGIGLALAADNAEPGHQGSTRWELHCGLEQRNRMA